MKDRAKFLARARRLQKVATPGPWTTNIGSRDGCFPTLYPGPHLPYSDGSGGPKKGGHRFGITFNEGMSPRGVAAGYDCNNMATCCANAELVAMLMSNLEEVLSALEKA